MRSARASASPSWPRRPPRPGRTASPSGTSRPSASRQLRDAADVAIYTPGSETGLPLSVLRSFAPPPAELLADTTALRDRVGSVVSGLLSLLGRDADPLQSREHILLANILESAWREGAALDMAGLIGAVQKPPFDKVGAFDLETFFPAKDRLALAMAINNLLASPGFSTWMKGEPLDVQRLLFTPEGKPRISIFSIAHLSDPERMFFVTLLLNEMIAWMRNQSGTSSLRALLYMDEIFGYFPPSANPPSKLPMLTLLKQARAFGLGCVLATQNPVDLDYKGLSNCGTWMIGRLQTERDKMRVIEGLETALAGPGGFDRQALERMMSALAPRVFLMRNVHDDAPYLMKSRWALSYLRGPLTGAEIARVMAPRKAALRAAGAAAGGRRRRGVGAASAGAGARRGASGAGVAGRQRDARRRTATGAAGRGRRVFPRADRRRGPDQLSSDGDGRREAALRRCKARPRPVVHHHLARAAVRRRQAGAVGRRHRAGLAAQPRLEEPGHRHGRVRRRCPARRCARPPGPPTARASARTCSRTCGAACCCARR